MLQNKFTGERAWKESCGLETEVERHCVLHMSYGFQECTDVSSSQFRKGTASLLGQLH